MRTIARLLLAPIAIAAAACGDPALPSLDDAPLAQVLADSGAVSGIVGMQAAVIVPGHAMWTATWGHELPATDMRAHALLSIGGISRTFVSALVLELAEQGRLSLADTTGKWITPSSTIPGNITVRQLLWGQSGLYGYDTNPAYANETMSRNLQKIWSPQDLLGFVGNPVFAPGTAWSTSNTGALALAIIAADVLDHSIESEIRQRFLAPLGLGATWFPDAAGTGPAQPVAASWNGATNFTASVLGPSVHTSRFASLGVMSTAGDVARWTQALFDGDAISAGARAHLTEVVADNGAVPGQTAAGPGVGRYGFLGRVQFGAAGSVENGSGIAVWDAESGIVVVVLMNQNQASHGVAQIRIAAALLEAALGSH